MFGQIRRYCLQLLQIDVGTQVLLDELLNHRAINNFDQIRGYIAGQRQGLYPGHDLLDTRRDSYLVGISFEGRCLLDMVSTRCNRHDDVRVEPVNRSTNRFLRGCSLYCSLTVQASLYHLRSTHYGTCLVLGFLPFAVRNGIRHDPCTRLYIKGLILDYSST